MRRFREHVGRALRKNNRGRDLRRRFQRTARIILLQQQIDRDVEKRALSHCRSLSLPSGTRACTTRGICCSSSAFPNGARRRANMAA